LQHFFILSINTSSVQNELNHHNRETTMKVKHLNTAAALLLAGFSMNAFAVDTSGTLDVSADISASCDFTNSPQNLAFGTVDLNVGATATATLTATCTTTLEGPVYAIATGLNDAAVAGYTYAMKDANTNYIGYNMTSNNAISGPAAPWSDNIESALEFTPSLAGAVSFDFNGSINAGDQIGYVGGSSVYDTVTVSVTF
jgi:hypothetical protein